MDHHFKHYKHQIFLLIIIFIVTIDAKTTGNQTQCTSPSYKSFRTYSKISSTWKTVNYTLPEDDDGCAQEAPTQFSTAEECARPCSALEAPKTCHYHFTLEYYKTQSGACNICQPSMNNSFLTSECQCILADGADVSGFMTANRMYPGPSIQVCLGDFVIVDVLNKISGNDVSLHWHGLYQNGYQYDDGVALLTQCPIPECTTYRYQFQTQNSGTFFWHAHSGLHKGDGLDGAIVIREPVENDPNRDSYDDDRVDNLIFISDWLHDTMPEHFPGRTTENIGQLPDTYLINGKGQFLNQTTGEYTTTPLAVFDVESGRARRFRLINACSLICPVEMTIQDHNMTIIAVDGSNVVPRTVTTLTTFSAERVDFVINATQDTGAYWIQWRGLGNCVARETQQVAILRYGGSYSAEPTAGRPTYSSGLPRGIVFNPVNDPCNNTNTSVCVKDLESTEAVHYRILKDYPDIQIYMPYYFHNFTDADLFALDTYKRFFIPSANGAVAATLGGISFINTPSPPISQLEDIPPGYFCDSDNLPASCANTSVCYCSHVRDVPLNAVVEVIFVDLEQRNLSHPFHLHGYGFHVMASGLSRDLNITEKNRRNAFRLSREVYKTRNYRPPVKDTLAVPSNGYTIVRFIADNPGWWFYHCHFLPHLYNGMAFILRVGDQGDLPPIPPNFPKCGSFIPPLVNSSPKTRKEIKKDRDEEAKEYIEKYLEKREVREYIEKYLKERERDNSL